MNPFQKKFASFTSFHKYEYREVSKPDQQIIEQIKNFNSIFFNWKYKATYMKDLKLIKEKGLREVPTALSLQLYYKIYKASEVVIGLYAVHSIYWHFKKGFFHTGSKLAEFYIVSKVIFNICVLSAFAFFVLKTKCDPAMYEYFSKKEEEWDENLRMKEEENKSIMEFRDLKEKMKKRVL